MPIVTPPAVPTLPVPPSTLDPEHFDNRADTFLDDLPAFGVAVDGAGQATHANAQHAEDRATSANASASNAAAAVALAENAASAAATSAGDASGSASSAATSAGAAAASATASGASATAADNARIAAESAAGVALGGAEPAIAAGTTAQYWRGDKQWQTLNKAAVGLGSAENTADNAKAVASAAKWTTTRTFTLGGTGKPVNGSADVSFTLAEMGAASTAALDAQLDILAGSTNALALTDRGRAVSITANTSIPADASVPFPDGSVVLLTCGATARTITGPAASSLTLEGSAAAVTSFTLKANKSVVIRKTGANAWRVFGDV